MEIGGIFINYRRYDGSGNPHDHALFVEILSHELAEHFGAENVFIDTSPSIVGEYPDQLRTKLGICDVLLVVIHPEWLDDLQERGDLLTDGDLDRVHYEISTVLNGNLHLTSWPSRRPKVIPVLLEKADPPKSVELPEDLQELALLQAFRLRFGSLTADLTRLITELGIHTPTSWPPSPTPDPKIQTSPQRTAGRKAPGWAASRGLAAAAFATSFVALAPTPTGNIPRTEPWRWASTTSLLLWSTITIVAVLLATVAITIFGRSLHQMEHRLHSQPAGWRFIVRLGLIVLAIILFIPLIVEFEKTQFFSLLIALPGIILLFFHVFVTTIREIREDSEWPPRVSTRPKELRRAIARLEHQLTSWQPPLSRIQREQAWTIIHQLDSAAATLRKESDRVRTRRGLASFRLPEPGGRLRRMAGRHARAHGCHNA